MKKCIFILLFILFISFILFIVFNFVFLLTDTFAGKIVDWKAIFYSPINNENWLEFWGIFLSAIVTFFLLFHYYNELKFNKNKIKYKNIIEDLKEEKAVVLEYLKEIEINDISEIILLTEKFITEKFIITSCLEISNRKREKLKNLNYVQLKLELTSLRVKEEKINELEEHRSRAYKTLCLLRELYGTFFEDISDCMINFLNEINEEKIEEEKRQENFHKLINKVTEDFYKFKYKDKYSEYQLKLLNKAIEESKEEKNAQIILYSLFNKALDNFHSYYIFKREKNNELL